MTDRGFVRSMPLLDDASLPRPDFIIADVGAMVSKRQGDAYIPLMPIQVDIAAK